MPDLWTPPIRLNQRQVHLYAITSLCFTLHYTTLHCVLHYTMFRAQYPCLGSLPGIVLCCCECLWNDRCWKPMRNTAGRKQLTLVDYVYSIQYKVCRIPGGKLNTLHTNERCKSSAAPKLALTKTIVHHYPPVFNASSISALPLTLSRPFYQYHAYDIHTYIA